LGAFCISISDGITGGGKGGDEPDERGTILQVGDRNFPRDLIPIDAHTVVKFRDQRSGGVRPAHGLASIHRAKRVVAV
jgi:hypothetical protein